MGQLVYIKLKSDNDAVIAEKNRVLNDLKVKNHFVTNEMNNNWLHDINAGDPAYNWMVKNGQPLTMAELHDLFEDQTTVGLLSFDVAFSRTSQALAKKYAKFIASNVDSIEYLKGADELISKYKLTQKEIDSINTLNKPYEDPELLPVEEQTNPDLQSGLFLCKTFSPSPFWVIFGKVERPTFLKVKKYKSELMNNIYRDKKGLAYLMLPLLPVNDKQIEFVQEVFEQAWGMGLRESYAFIIPYLYGLDIMNFKEVADDFKEMYTQEELKERFYNLVEQLANHGDGCYYSVSRKRFIPSRASEEGHPSKAKYSIVTCLLYALGADEAAKLMSKLTGKKYLPIEFKY